MTECEHNRACRMAYGDEGCKPPCDLGFPCHLYERKVDRDALLAMIEEMVETFRLGAFTGEGLDAKWCRELHDKYVRRIREALGVEDYAGHNDEPA